MKKTITTAKKKSTTKKPRRAKRPTPRHKWTNGGEYVLILKCTNSDGKSHHGFQWPESGTVAPEKWSREPTCGSGGLFGWPWGFAFGHGKVPDYAGRWIVFRAHRDDVVEIGCGKVKAVPNPEHGRTPEVIFCGGYVDALAKILPGHIAWVQHASRGAPTASGPRGAATASADCGAATASGYSGAATASGYRGAAAASGPFGAATASGPSGAATASGPYGAATASAISGAATASGYSGAATASGISGAAAASADYGAATASGIRGAAAASGDYGAATASGIRGAALITGELSTIEVSPTGLAAVRASEFYWRVRAGAVLVQRSDDGYWMWTSETIGAKDGDLLRIRDGIVIDRTPAHKPGKE
ncbi:MAG: hypothetical protein ACYCQK_01295 [Acidiferrobacteraceae bacterium]